MEGHTPTGANTLLAALPLTVTDLDTKTLPAISKFEAPKEVRYPRAYTPDPRPKLDRTPFP